MSGAWTVNVNGHGYGPYDSERMRAFIREGRLGPHSLVARDGGALCEAQADTGLAAFFAEAGAAAPAAGAVQEPASAAPETSHGGRAQFFIVADLRSRSPGNLEQAIMSLGTAYKLLPNIWIVSTGHTVGAVRNHLVQELGKLDKLFVVDATHGKAAWFNFGPEADARIRRVWQKAS